MKEEYIKLYVPIKSNNLYEEANKLFDFITTAERIDLDYEMKMTREFTVESVSNIINKISEYSIEGA